MTSPFAWPLAPAILLAVSGAATAQDLNGLWTLSIHDSSLQARVTMQIRFTDRPGQSCSGDNWKKVEVETVATSNKKSFPINDALTYQFDGADIIIGRNAVCDGYLRLKGKFNGSVAEGNYYAFGKGGVNDLGTFVLSRNRQ